MTTSKLTKLEKLKEAAEFWASKESDSLYVKRMKTRSKNALEKFKATL